MAASAELSLDMEVQASEVIEIEEDLEKDFEELGHDLEIPTRRDLSESTNTVLKDITPVIDDNLADSHRDKNVSFKGNYIVNDRITVPKKYAVEENPDYIYWKTTNARLLVKSQQDLVRNLQFMKEGLGRMEQEINTLKEGLVFSRRCNNVKTMLFSPEGYSTC
ncbi:unnamed protein product [Owenia fusiformis]|uniref:Uncharacterized protein n=1 Tax=Owenia fusiformis TaxID=6347 RepID=A0A8S4N2D6_OWEFU|nr:unnamed protein product [Owenia fusiformis]